MLISDLIAETIADVANKTGTTTAVIKQELSAIKKTSKQTGGKTGREATPNAYTKTVSTTTQKAAGKTARKVSVGMVPFKAPIDIPLTRIQAFQSAATNLCQDTLGDALLYCSVASSVKTGASTRRCRYRDVTLSTSPYPNVAACTIQATTGRARCAFIADFQRSEVAGRKQAFFCK